MNSGASTWPTKILAAVDNPTAPPTSSVFSSTREKPRTIGGMMPPIEQQRRQHAHHQHDGQRLKAENESAAGVFSSNGSGPPPT